MRRIPVLLGLVAVTLAGGCGSKPAPAPAEESQPAREAESPAAPAATDTRPAIVCFGDSLSAGYGLQAGESYPDVLQRLLDAKHTGYRVVNAGVSGDTTGGGLMRLDSVLEAKPVLVILELGANDGLRGLPVETTRDNLDEMIRKLQAAGVKVVLAGMTLPPNYGANYVRKFEQVYKDLARKYKLTLIPFLLEGVAGTPQYMQSDGLHPNAEGTRRVAATVQKYVAPLLK